MKIDNLPANWVRASLDSVCQVEMGQSPPSETYNLANEGLPFFQGKTEFKELYPTIKKWCRTPGKVVEKDAILICVRAPVGPTNLAPEKCCIGRGLAGLLPRTGISGRFIMYGLRAYEDQLVQMGAGSTFDAISSSDLRGFILPVAPRAEQRRIVEKIEELLSDLDAAVVGLKRIQANLKRYRASVLQAAVEGRLTAAWRRENPPTETGEALLARIIEERRAKWEEAQLKKFAEQGKTPPKDWRKKYKEPVAPTTAGLPELPEGWKFCGLDQILKFDRNAMKTGPFGSLLKKAEHRRTGVPVLGIENIEAMRFLAGSKIHIEISKAADLSGYKVDPGDLVISRSGTVGEICVIPDDIGEAIISTNLMKLSLAPEGMIPMFFCCLFNGSPAVLGQIHDLCKGSTRDFLNQDILKKLILPLPSLIEQKEILSEISRSLSIADAAEKTLDSALKRAAPLRQSILKRAFEGRLAPQDPNDEPASALLERIHAERSRPAVGRTATSTRKPRRSQAHGQ